MAIEKDLSIDQGTTFEKTFTITGSDGTALDISGFTFDGKIRHRIQDTGDALEKFTFESGSPTSDGKFTISLTDEQTANLPPTRLRYDIQYTKPNGKTFVTKRGRLNNFPEVSF